MKYDIIIIGAGPGGLTAALYAARYKLNTLVLGKLPGGTATEAHRVCNFPTYDDLSGTELMMKMINQVKNQGVEIKQEEVEEINKQENEFKIKTKKQEYNAKKIIYATGSKRRKLDLEREEELKGKGVSYCATCDAGFFKDKIAGVVGGGSAAITAALLLSKYASKVYIIYRKSEFCKAEPAWVEELEKNEKIKPIFDSQVTKLIGEEKLEEIELNNKDKMKIDGLFVEIGSIPNTKLAEELGAKIDCEYVEVDKEMKTNIPGFFAAGDVTNNPLKQIITACGEGAIAAYTAYGEISKKE